MRYWPARLSAIRSGLGLEALCENGGEVIAGGIFAKAPRRPVLAWRCLGCGSASAVAATSLKTEGTLRPLFENIVCKWTPETPRHDHQLIFPLSDDRLMLVWSEYYANRPALVGRKPTTRSGEAADNVPCRIAARISTDRCRTWSDRFILQDNVWKYNVKHPNLVRLPSGELLFFFVGWDSNEQRNVFMKRSQDNCESWSEMVRISRPGWICNNHGRILRLSSGRIVLPAHVPVKDGVVGRRTAMTVICIRSSTTLTTSFAPGRKAKIR